VMSSGPGDVDAALLGVRDRGLAGEGDVASVTFEALASGAPSVRLGQLAMRDAANRPVGASTAAARPTETALMPVAPNPASGPSLVRFALAHASAVGLAVYGVDGRLVRQLARDSREPGLYQVSWDGRDAAGQPARPGLYFVRLVTDEARFTRTVTLVR